jgi:WD40 repeat protein
VAFAPDGSQLASGGFRDGTVRIWPLRPESGETNRIVFQAGRNDPVWDVDFSPDGQRLLVGQHSGRVHVVPLDGGPARLLEGRKGQAMTVAFGPQGRLAAASGGQWTPEERVIHVWDLETGRTRILDAGDGHFIRHIRFLRDGRLLSVTDAGGGLRLWDVEEERSTLLREGTCKFALSPDERYVFAGCWEGSRHWTQEGTEGRSAEALPLVRIDLATGAAEPQEQHFESGELMNPIALDPSGTRVITGDGNGPVRVRPVAGGPEHLLLGHEGMVWDVAVSPDGHWIASTGMDGTVRVWPMPEGPPFHKLPYEELLDRIRRLTNLRVVDDENSTTGYRVEVGPFPGWETVPTW